MGAISLTDEFPRQTVRFTTNHPNLNSLVDQLHNDYDDIEVKVKPIEGAHGFP